MNLPWEEPAWSEVGLVNCETYFAKGGVAGVPFAISLLDKNDESGGGETIKFYDPRFSGVGGGGYNGNSIREWDTDIGISENSLSFSLSRILSYREFIFARASTALTCLMRLCALTFEFISFASAIISGYFRKR